MAAVRSSTLGIVSHSFFRSMRVTFDFARMEITLARPRG
jgi:hypothetical protein